MHTGAGECGGSVPLADVQRAVREMVSTDIDCPDCGNENRIGGFSKVEAFLPVLQARRKALAEDPQSGYYLWPAECTQTAVLQF